LDSNNGNAATQLGTVSFGGIGGTCTGGPKVFARVTYFLGWLSGKIGQGWFNSIQMMFLSFKPIF